MESSGTSAVVALRRRLASKTAARAALVVLVFVATFALRVHGVTTSFLLLRDQMRDWRIALSPFHDLPLVGPPTHVGGYTIGPAFYWILWTIRVTLGPWFENLPHAGGIGQAALQSAVDALLFVAVWRRWRSIWIALATVVLLATASADLSLAATIWNPVVGSTLAKCAFALVLLDWHKRTPVSIAALVAVAWAAVHAYTGAIYVAVGVFTAIMIVPLTDRSWRTVWRNGAIIAGVVLLLQIPFLWFQVTTHFRSAAMGGVTDSLTQVLSGQSAPQVTKSIDGLVGAVNAIQIAPFTVPYVGLILLAAAVVVAVRYRRDPAVLALTLMPLALAIVGYALFLAGLASYFYLSLMPSVVLTMILAVMAYLPPRATRVVGIAFLVGALAILPSRVRFSETMNRMPEYGALVRASRTLARRDFPLRAIRTDFRLPPTGDPRFLYSLLGGRLEPTSHWVATINRRGDISFEEQD